MTKAKADTVTVYPVAGAYLAGIPTAPLVVSAAAAERLVSTGAFGYDAPVDTTAGDPIVLADDALGSLDFYAPSAPTEE